MKVLYAISALAGGGAEVFTTQLACAMARRSDTEVHFVTYAGVLDDKGVALKRLLDAAGVIYHSPNVRNNIRKFLLPIYYARLINTVKPDVIHSNLDHTDLLIALGKHLVPHRKICFVRTIHNIVNAEKTFSTRVMKWLFSQFDYNIGCSTFVKTHYVYPEMRSRIIAINNGIEMRDQLQDRSLRTRYSIGANELVFLQIGDLKKRVGQLPKAHDIVFQAFRAIPNLKCKVLFLGDNSNINKDYLVEWYSDPRFIFLGLKEDVYPYIQMSDIILAPSRFEGLPISTIEAVCQGLPLLCSDIEGFKCFHGSSTVICKVDDIKDLKEKIVYCSEHLNLLKRNGQKNAEHFRSIFNIENVLNNYIEYYKKK